MVDMRQRFVYDNGSNCIVDNDGFYGNIGVSDVDMVVSLLNALNCKNENCIGELDCLESIICELRVKYRDSFFKLSLLDEIVRLKRGD